MKGMAMKDLGLVQGDRVYTSLEHVTASGMGRWIKVFIVRNGEILPIHYDLHVDEQFPYTRRGNNRSGLYLGGCGMDMGYQIVYTMSQQLFGDGYQLKHSWL